MLRNQRVLVAIALVFGTLAGCLGEDDETPQPPKLTAEPQPSATITPLIPIQSAQPNLSALRFPLAAAVNVTEIFTGVFEPADTGLGGGFVTGAFKQEVDLSHLVPPEIPVHLEIVVTIEAEEIPVAGPTSRADPISSDTVWYESAWRHPLPGHYTLTAVVKRSDEGTVGVSLEAYAPASEDPPDVDYTVEARVLATPEGIPTGVPVAFTARGNQSITFRTGEDRQAELLLYGNDERLLDRLFFVSGQTWTVPSGADGELVVVPILGATDLRIMGVANETGEAGTLRALSLVREDGEPHELPMMESTTWDFDVDPRPMRVLLTVLGPSGAPWTCVGSLNVVLTGPDGTLLEATSDCPSPTNMPFLYEERRMWATQVGDTALVAGTYSVEVDNSFWFGHQAFHAVERYVR